jgi:peptidoglycan-associated lipoprotein
MSSRFWKWSVPVIAVAVGALLVAGCGKKPKSEPITEDHGSRAPADTGSTAPTDGGDGGTTETISTFDLSDVHFAYDDYSLSDEAKRVLSENGRLLKDNPDHEVLIEGHCDERGTVEYNLALGERRAHAARNYLKNLGVEDTRLSTISYGKERPLNPGHDEAAWAQNRRAHFVASRR